jgi:prepilin-type N-terminal cleavage/methylation domain-containing protein
MTLRSPRQPMPCPVSRGFTLVELLVVVAIMAVVMGMLAMSLSQARGPTVQIAAGQVASGLALARQLAIAKQTETRFVIASVTNGPQFPDEPFRYWTVISSNRSANNIWVMEREWERLPLGAVFLNLSASNYTHAAWGQIPEAQVGVPFTPTNDPSAQDTARALAWSNIQSFTTNQLRIAFPDTRTNAEMTWPTNLPYIGFGRGGTLRLSGMSGRLFNAGAGATRLVGLRVAEGSSEGNDKIILRSVNNARYVEAHDITGRILIRKKEDYND